jgi:ADP-ribose pyrophosphatase
MAGTGEHERTLRSERGFDGKLVRVRVDHVQLPSGRESVREVVEHPGAVAILALTIEDEIILVRQWRHAVGARLLEIPAGTREPDEPEAETARRELVEETGFAPGEVKPVLRFFSSAGYSNEELTLLVATGCAPVTRDADPDEGTEVVLVPRADLPLLLEPGEDAIRDAKTLIGLLWLLRGDSAAEPASSSDL